MPSWWEPIFFIELLLLALTAPILYLSHQFPPAILALAFALLAATWLWRKIHLGIWMVQTPVTVPVFFLFLIMLPIAVWAAPEPLRTTHTWPRFYALCWSFCLFWSVVTHGSRSYFHLRLTLLTMLLLGLGIAAIGPLGANWLYKLPLLSDLIAYIPNVLGGQNVSENAGFHPNTIAGLLLYILPLLILLVLKGTSIRDAAIRNAATGQETAQETIAMDKPSQSGFSSGGLSNRGFFISGKPRQGIFRLNSPPPHRFIWGASLLLTALVLGIFLLTQSRAGILALLIALISLRLLVWHKRRTLVIAAILAVLFLVPFTAPIVIESLAGAPWTETMGGVNTLNFREDIWGRAGLLIQHFPITGIGLGTFSELVWLYDPPLESNIARIDHAHNFFLQTALDFGLPGLLATLVILGIAFARLMQMLSQAPHADRLGNKPVPESHSALRLIALGLAATFVGQIFFFQLDSISMGNRANFMFWLYLANVFALLNVFKQHHVVAESDRAVANKRPQSEHA